jgi:hypothetical protein
MNKVVIEEKIKNPLRKQSLEGQPTNKEKALEWIKAWIPYIKSDTPIQDEEDRQIRTKYKNLYKNFPDRADKWLNSIGEDLLKKYFIRDAMPSHYKKIMEYRGFKVYLDDKVSIPFDNSITGRYNFKTLERSITQAFWHIWGILPNRKPNIIITDAALNKKFHNLVVNPAAIYKERLIYVDQDYINNPKVFAHEIAHFAADLIPRQTQPLLKKAYDDLLDGYFRSSKTKKRSLEPRIDSDKSKLESQELRKKISAKLGFPEYGLMNFDEFFAVLIEKWHDLPNNSNNYRFKSMVKNVLNRL